MSSPVSSPSFRHTRSPRPRQSPVEIKERMRKSYKERIHNSRNLFINNLRGALETDLRSTLSSVLHDMFLHDKPGTPDDEEYQVYDNIKEELVQDEMKWLLEEYEKANVDNIDWAALELKDDVICLTCQKVNLVQQNDTVTCPRCGWSIRTNKTLSQIKSDANSAMEIHNQNCNSLVQFTRVTELNEEHVYLICGYCSEIRIIL